MRYQQVKMEVAMLTRTDIKKLKTIFATKKDFERFFEFSMETFVTRDYFEERIENLPTRDDFQRLLDRIDGFAKRTGIYHDEMEVLGRQVDRHEEWIGRASKKTGIKYER